MTGGSVRPFLLVVEDDSHDAELIQNAISSTPAASHVCTSVPEAKSYLQGVGKYGDRVQFPLPTAILCDLCLGSDSGTRLLRWLKESDQFAAIPAYVLTGVSTPMQRSEARELGACLILEKPDRYERLRDLIQNVVASALNPASIVR
jgi:CheY-like chemotaxis protein